MNYVETDQELRTIFSVRRRKVPLDLSFKRKNFDNQKKRVMKIDSETNEILKIYDSLKEASIDMKGKPHSTIGRCLRGEQETSCGFKWEYVNPKYRPKKKKVFGKKNEKKAVMKIDPETDEVLQVFESIRNASMATIGKRQGSSIVNCVKGRQKLAYGFKWQYVDPKHRPENS